jgi:hypothetical protein
MMHPSHASCMTYYVTECRHITQEQLCWLGHML